MQTIKTTLVFPRTTWFQFQKITGKKKSSEMISRILSTAVRQYHANQLLSHQVDSSWDDRYLKTLVKKELQDARKLHALA